jgi:RimJ/RimL family protein N-acetyltransferase
MMGVRVTTNRLELIAGTVALARAEICDRLEFSRLLDVHVPGHWPPPLENADTMALNLHRLEEAPDETGWWTWYLVLREDASSARFLVGVAGFKGKPTSDGTVEIGYSVLRRAQGFGYATEAVKGLLSWAFEHAELSRVTAETLPELTPSIRVLEKSGFVTVGEGSEEGFIRFELSRAEYERA